MLEAGLLAVVVGDLPSGGTLAGCGLGEFIGLLVTWDRGVGRNPSKITSLSLAVVQEQTSKDAAAKRCPGLRVSVLILSMAAVESKNMVYRRPLSLRSSKVHRAR